MPHFRILIPAICLLALWGASIAIRLPSPQKGAPVQTDVIWADALWDSLLAYEDEKHEDLMAEKFTLAIGSAEDKAPIYVSYGAIDSAGWRIAQKLENAVTAAMIERTSPDSTEDASWQIRFKQQIRSSLEQQTSKLLTGRTSQEHFEEIEQLMSQGTDLSELCFRAAVSEDPDYMPGWYYLALYSSGDQRAEAFAEWAKRDPDNAFPLYQSAIDLLEERENSESDRHDDANFLRALKLIEAGNKRRVYRKYSVDWPSSNPTGNWSDSKELIEVFPILSHEKLTITGVKNLKTLLDRKSEGLSVSYYRGRYPDRELRETAINELKLGRKRNAMRILKAMFEMGVVMHHGEPYHGMADVHGMALMFGALKPIDLENQKFRFEAETCRYEDLKHYKKRLLIFNQMLTSFDQKFINQLLSGKIDLLKWEQDLAEEFVCEPPLFYRVED